MDPGDIDIRGLLLHPLAWHEDSLMCKRQARQEQRIFVGTQQPLFCSISGIGLLAGDHCRANCPQQLSRCKDGAASAYFSSQLADGLVGLQ